MIGRDALLFVGHEYNRFTKFYFIASCHMSLEGSAGFTNLSTAVSRESRVMTKRSETLQQVFPAHNRRGSCGADPIQCWLF